MSLRRGESWVDTFPVPPPVTQTGRVSEERVSRARAAAFALVEKTSPYDGYTATHACNVSRLSESVGEYLGLAEDDLEALRLASMLHDIGKVEVPKEVLGKPGRLTPEEYEQVKVHPEAGARMIEADPELYDLLWEAVPIIRHHHERWDGAGYPEGLAGEQIPVNARIVAAADAYDVMVAGRYYQPALPGEAAIVELERTAGSQFDPAAARALVAVQRERESG